MDAPPASEPVPATTAQGAAVRRPRVWHLYVLVSLAQVLIVLTVVVGAGVIAAMSGAVNADMPPAQANAAMMGVFRSPAIVVVGLGASAFIGGLVALLVGWLSPRPFVQRLRVGRGRLSWPEVTVATVGFVAFSFAFGEIAESLPGHDRSALILLRDLFRNSTVVSLPLLVLLVGVAAPVSEELLYRGALQTRFAERYGPRIGVVVASVCFAVAHMDPVQSLFALFAGLYLGWICDLAVSCRAALVVHAANNLAAALSATWLGDSDEGGSGAIIAAALLVTATSVWWLRRRVRDRTLTTRASSLPSPIAAV